MKYKSQREEILSFIFPTEENQEIDLANSMNKMYEKLERPINIMQKQDHILEKILTTINEELTKEDAIKNQHKIEKNNATITRLKKREKSFKSLISRVRKAIEKSS